MYIPAFNRVADQSKINAFIRAHGFATIVTQKDGALWASHLPVLLDENAKVHGTLRSHMARANEQWRHFTPEQEVLCIFQGPHAYISPSWYVMQHTVPTWNYAAIHVYGIPALIEDLSALKQIVYDTTQQYESPMPKPWAIPLSEEEFDAMGKAIVGFKIEITRVEAKFKLGQNRSQEDQASMLHALQNAPDTASRELADFIVKEGVKSE
jgi:transcriptional regulator